MVYTTELAVIWNPRPCEAAPFPARDEHYDLMILCMQRRQGRRDDGLEELDVHSFEICLSIIPMR